MKTMLGFKMSREKRADGAGRPRRVQTSQSPEGHWKHDRGMLLLPSSLWMGGHRRGRSPACSRCCSRTCGFKCVLHLGLRRGWIVAGWCKGQGDLGSHRRPEMATVPKIQASLHRARAAAAFVERKRQGGHEPAGSRRAH